MQIGAKLEYHKAEPFALAQAGFDERWLQERIEEDPSILGLGDVNLLTRERRQSPGGGSTSGGSTSCSPTRRRTSCTRSRSCSGAPTRVTSSAQSSTGLVRIRLTETDRDTVAAKLEEAAITASVLKWGALSLPLTPADLDQDGTAVRDALVLAWRTVGEGGGPINPGAPEEEAP